jgi:hypothetical protein
MICQTHQDRLRLRRRISLSPLAAFQNHRVARAEGMTRAAIDWFRSTRAQ